MPTLSVSVIIPTFNRAALLREAIESVFQQTYPISEIVVADDGSTDNTAEMMDELRREVPHLIHLRGRHEGRLGPLRNRGVAASSSDLLAFLDSDDLWLPQRIEKQVAALEARQGAGAGFCNLQRFNAAGLFPEGPWLSPQVDYSGRVLDALFLEPIITASTMVVRRELFLSLGGYSSGYLAEQPEFSLRLAASTEVSYVAEPLVLLRAHDNQVSTAHNLWPLMSQLAMMRRFVRNCSGLSPREHAMARQGMANIHYKLVRAYMKQGNKGKARRHLIAQARLRPLDRRVWDALLRVL